jgi:hypothetical protein
MVRATEERKRHGFDVVRDDTVPATDKPASE